MRGVAVTGREGRGALAAALFSLGCAGEIWYLNPDLIQPREPLIHVVGAKAESVCALAGRYGVAAPALLRANGLSGSGQAVAPGTRVRLASEPLRHRIAPGETLAGLARWYGLPVTKLVRENGIRDPDLIAADRWLRIPPGARTGCPPPTLVARASPGPLAVAETPAPLPAVTEESAPPAPQAESSHEAVRRMLARAQSRYDAADFEAALELAKSSLHLLEREADGQESARLRARASWISGLCYTALGRTEPAIAGFRAALDLDPSLADEKSMSPKVRTLVESARIAVAGTP